MLDDTTNSFETLDVEPPLPVGDINLKQIHQEFNAQTVKAGLHFGNPTEHNLFTAVFLASLATKPFVILSGVSGSGKTHIATTFGEWIGHDQMLVQPVRPDWITPEALLGYEDKGSDPNNSQYSWHVPRTLEFILKAARDPSQPYLLVLEEMNMAHVERYFADVLSGMESNQPIVPNLVNDATGWRIRRDEDEYIPWPRNIFIVGTVNVDETTYEFSAKVLDRASVIEFRVEPGSFLRKYPAKEPVDIADSRVSAAFLQRALNDEAPWDSYEKVGAALQAIHQVFYDHAAEFGHRVFRESLRFGSMLNEMGVTDVSVILDLIMVERVIPKFDTTRGFGQDLLLKLAGFAAYGPGKDIRVDPLDAPEKNNLLPKTMQKLRRIAIANQHVL